MHTLESVVISNSDVVVGEVCSVDFIGNDGVDGGDGLFDGGDGEAWWDGYRRVCCIGDVSRGVYSD